MNKLFCMDNLELMRTLSNDSIDLIYCDILYNTGKNFNDYNDNLGSTEDAINWYKPRLAEMYRILKITGSIYLQMDYRLVHYLKVEMDKVFGIENFKNDIIWSYKSMSTTKNLFPRKHDNILFYTKSKNYIFNYEDEFLQTPYSQETIKRSKTKAGFNNNQSNYLKSDTYLKNDVWDDISFLKNGVEYNTQKPKKILERIISASSNKGDLVADFFMGSGTTCVVAKEMGRNYIGCDINPKSIEITINRLKDAH